MSGIKEDIGQLRKGMKEDIRQITKEMREDMRQIKDETLEEIDKSFGEAISNTICMIKAINGIQQAQTGNMRSECRMLQEMEQAREKAGSS